MSAPLNFAIARIRKADGAVVGTGFLVTGRQVLTCAHVAAQALEIPATTSEVPVGEVILDFPLLSSSRMLSARVVFWLPVKPPSSSLGGHADDVAILELRSVPDDSRPLRLVRGEDLWG